MHPQELILVVLASIQLCFLPWAIGGVVLWAQLISLGISMAAFAMAVQRRVYQEPYSRDGNYLLLTLPKLWRFPIFWLGLLFLGYIALQGLNPSHVRMSDDRGWWMDPVVHITWLPSGMQTPFEYLNAWRVLIIFGSAWLLVCALWIGITRRTAVMGIITALVINGTVLALVGILQKVTNAREILWFVKVRWSYFVATIVYKNHAGAYFYLIMALAAALLLWHAQRGSRRLARTSPAPVYGFCAAILGLIVLLSFSKGAILLMVGYLTICLGAYIAWLIFGERNTGNNGTGMLLAGLLAVFIAVGGVFLGVGESFVRVKAMLENGQTDSSVTSRQTVTEATWDMAKDKVWTGWGAGSFQHYFPVYQKNYPDITTSYVNKPLFWRYAHNDYVQSLAEYGIIGLLFPVAMLGWWLKRLIGLEAYRRPVILLALGGLFLIMVHCWIDFQMQNPAILTTWCACWVLITRWAETERS